MTGLVLTVALWFLAVLVALWEIMRAPLVPPELVEGDEL